MERLRHSGDGRGKGEEVLGKGLVGGKVGELGVGGLGRGGVDGVSGDLGG